MTDVAYDIEQIRKYLHGRLSEEEELLFQDRLARDPQLVRELEQSLRMRQGLKQLQAEGYFELRARRTAGLHAAGGALRWLLPVAAAAVIGFVCLGLWLEAPTSLLTAKPTAQAVHPFNLIAMRGAVEKAPLPQSGNVEFRIRPETLAASYRITLLRDRKPLGSVSVSQLDADGYAEAYADSARLRPGDYSIEIASDSGTALGGVDFTLQPPEARATR